MKLFLPFDPLRKTVQRKVDTICQNLPEISNSQRANKARESFGCIPGLRPSACLLQAGKSFRVNQGGQHPPHTLAGSASVFFRKEVIQPQVLLRLPCYDFTPIMSHTLGACLLAVSVATSSTAHFRDVTGGVYKARERIHGVDLIRHY
jgi:hypothetical protein